jgi:hypothetical protein
VKSPITQSNRALGSPGFGRTSASSVIPKIRILELRDVPSFRMFSSPLIYLSSYKKTKGREQTDGNPTHCLALGLAWKYLLIESFGRSFNYKDSFVGMVAPKLLPKSNERNVMDWTRV